MGLILSGAVPVRWIHLVAAIASLFSLTCGVAHIQQPASQIDVANPATSWQLLDGFYGLEANSWRWTARRFVILLQPPRGADRSGGFLSLRLTIPGAQIEKLGPMTLSAVVDDSALEPETFTQGGNYTYLREVPARPLKTNIVPIVFTFNQALAPMAGDGRELAAVVLGAALRSK